MSNNTLVSDYSRYFGLRQKVYLVNMSADRDSGLYESLSGVVVASGMNVIKLMVTHSACEDSAEGTTYKLTSEALGSGIQVLADLVAIEPGNVFECRMHGTLELFQRRTSPRVDLSAPIFHLNRNNSLAFFKKEWKRIMDKLNNNIVLPGLDLLETGINLSASGIGITLEATNRPTPISMFFLELDKGLPICVLAETIWERRMEDGLRCGFRFIHILKVDQERINNCVNDEIRKSGGTTVDFKRNWALVDKMVSDLQKPSKS